jgi:RHS repeat-associated protein
MGSYDLDIQDEVISAGQSLRAWPRLEPFVPAVHFQGAGRLYSYEAYTAEWLMSDPALPEFLSNMPDQLSASTGFWCSTAAQTTLSLAATEPHEILYYHTDHLGSSNVITDVDGSTVQAITYYPFGHPRNDSIVDEGRPFHPDYRFIGKERDKESGLNLFDARYLESSIGRFISVDPAFVKNGTEDPQSLNPYCYVENNPLNRIDPDGRKSLVVITGLAKQKTGYRAGEAYRFKAYKTEVYTNRNSVGIVILKILNWIAEKTGIEAIRPKGDKTFWVGRDAWKGSDNNPAPQSGTGYLSMSRGAKGGPKGWIVVSSTPLPQDKPYNPDFQTTDSSGNILPHEAISLHPGYPKNSTGCPTVGTESEFGELKKTIKDDLNLPSGDQAEIRFEKFREQVYAD